MYLFSRTDKGLRTKDKRSTAAWSSVFRLATVVLGALSLLLLIGEARAQFQMAPGFNQNATFNTGATSNAPLGGAPNRPGNAGFFNPSNLGNYAFMTSSAGGGGGLNSPYGGRGGYGGYPSFPFFGYGTYIPQNMGNLYGSATVINSFGQLMTQTQQAHLMQEQVQREKLENRRRVLEQWLWERNNLPTLEDDRERLQQFALRRSRHEPPTTEIFAGRSLNDLLADIQRLQGKGAKAPDRELPPDIAGQVNFTPKGKGAANAGVLKDFRSRNKLDWPVELRGEDYQKQRDLLESLTRDAIQQAATKGQVDVGTLQEMERAIAAMSEELKTNLNRKDLSPSAYNPARNYLTDLSNGLRALGDADAKNYFTDKYSARGKSVASLVTDMQNKGLEFGPATPTQQPAYVALQRYLAAYDIDLNTNAGFQTEQPPR